MVCMMRFMTLWRDRGGRGAQGRDVRKCESRFFIAHYGSSGPRSRFGVPPWIDAATRLARSGVLSIAVIRGRVRGGGSEFTLGCDIRFASREKAIFGQPEVGTGLIPGGGALERLPLLVGRSRAVEIVMGANDFDANTAERYGWINRAVPDAELDAFVVDFVGRVLSFDRTGIAGREVNHQ
jgi:enoyl-CoA hydratase/carnithine racemase